MVRSALVNATQSSLSNITSTQGQQIEIPIQIITAFEDENQEQTSTTTITTTNDTREYTEKRAEIKDKR
jgi:Fe-S cluster assembly scaffold protein SufB